MTNTVVCNWAHLLFLLILNSSSSSSLRSSSTGSSSSRQPLPFFVLVDPLDDFGTTSALREALAERRILLVPTYSPSISLSLLRNERGEYSQEELRDVKELTYSTNAADLLTLHGLEQIDCLGVLCESDTGLRVAEEIGTQLRPDLYTQNEARRDKYLQAEALRVAGLVHIHQVLTDEWAVAEEFLSQPQVMRGRRSVIKPARGSASVGVQLAPPYPDPLCQQLFEGLLAADANLGYSNNTVGRQVLVQEFVEGVEFAIDTVSCAGEHKVLASWRYDKREMNSSPFVYCGTVAADANTDPCLPRVWSYCCQVLEALNVKNGPCHLEVKMRRVTSVNSGGGGGEVTEGEEGGEEPVLVEANCGRWHGQDFLPLANMCFGCNAVDAAIDTELYAALPTFPPPLRCFGRILHLSSQVSGTLTQDVSLSESDLKSRFASLFSWMPLYEGRKGERVERTIDLKTTAGYALLIGLDHESVERDYNQLLRWSAEEMYVIDNQSLPL